MAGLWVVTMILMFGLSGIVISVILSITLTLVARKRLPESLPKRRAFLSACGFAPFLGLFWLIAALLIHVWVSNNLAHQDCGLSGDPYVTLPNGYVVGSLNTYSGYVRAPDVQTGMPFSGPGYVRSLVDIDYQNGVFTGTFDDNSTLKTFVFNTRDRSVQTGYTNNSISFDQVQNAVHQDGNSYWILYRHYRHHWPNYLLSFLIVAGEFAVALWLWRLWTSIQHRALDYK
jgi:hypothetical protein